MKQKTSTAMRLRALVLSVLLTMPLWVLAQISGVVVDAEDGGPVPYATVQYKGNRISAVADGNGRFRIERHNGWRLTISSVGYREQVINVNPPLFREPHTQRGDRQVEEEIAL